MKIEPLPLFFYLFIFLACPFFWLCFFIKVIFIFKNSMLILLTSLQPIFCYIYTRIMHQKISGFLIFSGVIEVGHWIKKCVNKISTFCISHSKAENLMRTVHQKL